MAEGEWRPERFSRRVAKLRARGRIIAAIREFFADQGFDEVDTPALQKSPGLEPHLHAFATRLVLPGEPQGRPIYLHTSPEFAMKKLLAAGMERIYQLAHVFRNGEQGALHHPEFAMLEWYRAGACYRALMGDGEALLRATAAACGVCEVAWRGQAIDLRAPWQYLSVADAFAQFC
ncbi:MAG: amino acid--tRNA ligase-related protein, partial [Stellaceae bacterium]